MISGAKPSMVACMMRWSAYWPKSSETIERQPVLTRWAGLYQRTILGSALMSISPEPSAMPNSPTQYVLFETGPPARSIGTSLGWLLRGVQNGGFDVAPSVASRAHERGARLLCPKITMRTNAARVLPRRHCRVAVAQPTPQPARTCRLWHIEVTGPPCAPAAWSEDQWPWRRSPRPAFSRGATVTSPRLEINVKPSAVMPAAAKQQRERAQIARHNSLTRTCSVASDPLRTGLGGALCSAAERVQIKKRLAQADRHLRR